VPNTLTTTLANVRSLIDEPVAQYWADSELTNWINQGCQEVQRMAEWKRAVANQSAVVAQQAYVAPSDLLRLYRLEFVPNNNTSYTYSLEFRGYNEMDAVWGNLKTLPSAYPEQFTLWKFPSDKTPGTLGLQILLYPVPNVAGTLNIYYYQAIVPVASGSDELDILPGWEDMIENFTAYRALRKDSDPRSKDFQSDYATQVEQLKTVSRTYTDQANWFSTGQQNYNPLFLDLEV
jgi:hypothetical protein